MDVSQKLVTNLELTEDEVDSLIGYLRDAESFSTSGFLTELLESLGANDDYDLDEGDDEEDDDEDEDDEDDKEYN